MPRFSSKIPRKLPSNRIAQFLDFFSDINSRDIQHSLYKVLLSLYLGVIPGMVSNKHGATGLKMFYNSTLHFTKLHRSLGK